MRNGVLSRAGRAMKSRAGRVVKAGLAVVGGVVAVSARAQASGVDYTGLTSQVDWTSTTAAVMAVSGTLVVLYMAIKGAKIVLAMIKGR